MAKRKNQNQNTEFASETNTSQVRRQNQQSAANAAANAANQNAATEFASETNVSQVKRQNQRSAANAAQQNQTE